MQIKTNPCKNPIICRDLFKNSTKGNPTESLLLYYRIKVLCRRKTRSFFLSVKYSPSTTDPNLKGFCMLRFFSLRNFSQYRTINQDYQITPIICSIAARLHQATLRPDACLGGGMGGGRTNPTGTRAARTDRCYGRCRTCCARLNRSRGSTRRSGSPCRANWTSSCRRSQRRRDK